ncbi:MAG: hypothetical protein CM1200mP41_17960 [Gammaproteobacteria bacterium]|nr:MAG: hypothetical protein CM1200mP41_17960 [Gammaproteobacteria bacterium]
MDRVIENSEALEYSELNTPSMAYSCPSINPSISMLDLDRVLSPQNSSNPHIAATTRLRYQREYPRLPEVQPASPHREIHTHRLNPRSEHSACSSTRRAD